MPAAMSSPSVPSEPSVAKIPRQHSGGSEGFLIVLHRGIGAFAEFLQRGGAGLIRGVVVELVRVFFEVVEKLIGGRLAVVSGIDVALPADALPGGYLLVFHAVFAEEPGAPVRRRFPVDPGHEAPSLVAFRRGHAREVEQRGGDVDVEGHRAEDTPAQVLRHARVVDDQRDAQGFLIVRPFPGKSAFGHVVAVVGRVNDDGVFGQAMFLESGCDLSDHVVHAREKAEIGPHVLLILLGGVPSPEEALAVHGFAEERGMGVENLGAVQQRRREDGILEHALDRVNAGIMVLLVAVLGVGGAETDREAEGVFRGTAVEESEGVFHVDFVDVAGGSVGLFAQVGPVALAEVVEEGFFRADFGLDPELADEPGTVSRGAQGRGVAGLEVGRANGRCAEREPVGALGETGENGGPAGGANRRGDERVLEADPLPGEVVDDGRLGDAVAGDAQRVIALVVDEEEEDIGPVQGGLSPARTAADRCRGAPCRAHVQECPPLHEFALAAVGDVQKPAPGNAVSRGAVVSGVISPVGRRFCRSRRRTGRFPARNCPSCARIRWRRRCPSGLAAGFPS